jgi:tripartite-type tricarboxylate transporter receptor subunit TctC
MRRRQFLGLSAAAVGSAMIGRSPARAAAWPDRPVRVVVPYAPGGASDIIARPWCEALSQAFGQQFVVENRGGAAGMIGVQLASEAPPDGYTLLLTPSACISVLPLLRKTPYDPRKSLAPVSRICDTLSGFAMNPAVGPKTFKEMIDYAKAHPGKLSYGSAGLGSIQHMRLEMIKYRAGVDILHVPYRGSGEALTDLLANNIQLMCEINPLPHVKAGKLILLCMNNDERSPEFPDVPTLTECGYPNSDLPSWYAIWGPAGLPDDIAEKINAKTAEIAKSPDMQQKMRKISAALRHQSRADITKFLNNDMNTNEELIKAAHITLE